MSISDRETAYQFSEKSKTWQEARDYCKTLWNGYGQLLQIYDQDENDYITRTMTTDTAWTAANWRREADLIRHNRDDVSDDILAYKATLWNVRLAWEDECLATFSLMQDAVNTSVGGVIRRDGKWSGHHKNGTKFYICKTRHFREHFDIFSTSSKISTRRRDSFYR